MSKLEQLSQKYQGFLVYHPERHINAILLDDSFEIRHRVVFKNRSVDVRSIDKEFSDYLKSRGWTIEKIQKQRTIGKKKLFGISVKVKKIKDKNNLENIEIKIVGNNQKNIEKKMDLIKQNLEKYEKKPKECIRQRPDLEDGIEDDESLEDRIEDDLGEVDEDIDNLYKEITEEPVLEIPKYKDEKNLEKEYAKDIKCPECGSESTILLLVTPNGNRHKCESCGDIFVI